LRLTVIYQRGWDWGYSAVTVVTVVTCAVEESYDVIESINTRAVRPGKIIARRKGGMEGGQVHKVGREGVK
jgi:hypothetical protein